MIASARLERTLDHALRAPSVHNGQPWRWRLRDGAAELFGDPAGRDTVISCGAALHHFVVALAHEGHDAYVTYSPDPDDDSHLARITVSDAPPDPTTARLFGAIARRHTERSRLSYHPVPQPLLAALVESARRFDVGLERVPEVREAFAAAYAEAAGRERWTPGRTTELHLRSRVAAGGPSEHRPPVDAAEFLLLTTVEDRTRDRLRAGQALSALLLTATNAGLATMPVSLHPGGGTLRRDDPTPQIVVRVGWPLVRGAVTRRGLASVLIPSVR